MNESNKNSKDSAAKETHLKKMAELAEELARLHQRREKQGSSQASTANALANNPVVNALKRKGIPVNRQN